DRARGSSFFAAATAVLIFLHSLRPLSASLLALLGFDVHSAGTSAFVMTPALRIALSPLGSAAATGPASARDAATGRARISNRLRWESIGAPYRPVRRGIARGPRGQPASRFAPDGRAEWGGRADSSPRTAPSGVTHAFHTSLWTAWPAQTFTVHSPF